MIIRSRWLFAVVAVAVFISLGGSGLAAGKYCLAFWRETGYYEKGGTGGMHIINVHVWDENGNPLPGKQIVNDSGLNLGTTDSNGQVEIAIYEPNAYALKVNDPGTTSDVTPGFSSTRPPDWGHYCFECGFIYKSDASNPGTFDLTYDGVFNSSAGQPCELSAPKTRSLAFYSTNPNLGYYCSDQREAGNEVASIGQTFKATGNRVVACKVHVRGSGIRYVARIREGGPTGPYVGTAAVSPYTGDMEYSKTLTKWPINAVQVVPGNTYYLEITRQGGGTLSAYRIANDNYGFGNYYENTTSFAFRELEGHVCCATVGGLTTGTIAGTVRDGLNNPLQGVTVSTNTGGYSATTAADGTYAITGIAPGTYSVTASKVGYQTVTHTDKQVIAGSTTTVDFNLNAIGGGAISGYVKNQSGVGISGAVITTNTGGYSATSASDGSYTINGVAAGTYDVTASATGYIQSTVYSQTVNAGQTTTVNFTLVNAFQGLKNGNFEGGFYNDPDVDHKTANEWRKFISSGAPKHGQRYYDTSRVWTQSFYEANWTAGIYQQVLGAVPGHKYTFKADVYGTNTAVSKWIGIDPKGGNNPSSADVQWTAANTTSGSWITMTKQVTAQNSTITVFVKGQNTSAANNELWIDNCTLTDDGATVGTISGYVRDNAGNGISGATVSTNSGGYSATSGAGGAYTIAGVVPGTYNVTASKSGWQSQTQTGKTVSSDTTTTVNFNLTDASAPTTPVVTDDGSYTTSSTSLHATWSASDPETGIAEYQYAIGTTPGGTNVVSWTSTGTTASVTKTGLSLNYTSTYYISVRARNADNQWSSLGSSDGIRVARVLNSVSAAKSYADGECVRITGTVVTAKYGNCLYVRTGVRSSGIKVTGATANEGTTVTVTGVLSTVNGERVITGAVVE